MIIPTQTPLITNLPNISLKQAGQFMHYPRVLNTLLGFIFFGILIMSLIFHLIGTYSDLQIKSLSSFQIMIGCKIKSTFSIWQKWLNIYFPVKISQPADAQLKFAPLWVGIRLRALVFPSQQEHGWGTVISRNREVIRTQPFLVPMS